MATGEDGPAAGKGAAMGRITTAVGEAAGAVAAVDIVESHPDRLVVDLTVNASDARYAVGVSVLGGGRHGTGQQRQASWWTLGSLDGRGRGGGCTGRLHGPALAAHDD